MKDRSSWTKVVIRHLPPSISKSVMMGQIDAGFSSRYNWFSCRPGKISQKSLRHSRAYIDFQSPGDVAEFAEFFDGHIFANEKGSQFRALVEYAPSQRVPKLSPKKDGREGTIFKDPEYMQFLEFIAKHENLPSAEVQLERREAEKAGGPKESVIVTPLMDFVRQKRATKSGSQRSSANGKLSRRAGGDVSSSPSSSKRRGPTSYVVRNGSKTSRSGEDRSTYMLMSRKEEQQLVLVSRSQISEVGAARESNVPVAPGRVEIGKRRLVLLKGKEKDACHISSSVTQQQNTTASVRNPTSSISFRHGQQHEVSGRFIRSIISKKDNTFGLQHRQLLQNVISERDKRPPRPPKPRQTAFSSVPHIDGKRSLDDKAAVNNLHGSASVGDKCMRNKDWPRSDGVCVSSDTFLSAQQLSEKLEGISMSEQKVGHKGVYDDMGLSAIGGRVGTQRNVGRHGLARGLKEVDNSVGFSEGKHSKRGSSAGYGSHERQVWVQKLGSGS